MEERQITLDPNTLKSIKIDLKQAGKGLFHCIENGWLLNFPGVIRGGFEFARCVSLEKDIGYLAWQLIETALLNTLIPLVDEYDQTGEPNRVVKDMFNQCVSKLMENNNFRIDTQSFNAPGDLPFLPLVVDRLREYIHTSASFGKDLPEQDTLLLLVDFKLRFIQEVNNEFSLNKTEYWLLDEFFNPRFIENESLAREWHKYRMHLMRLIDYPLFDNSVNLSDVYIQLRGVVYEKIEKENNFGFCANVAWKKQICIVDRYLLDWIEKGDRDDTLKIISGGPGYGKSTILKNLASSLARQGKNVFFIPLHKLDIDNDIDLALNRYFKDMPFFRSNPIDNEQENILIFDGLDELIMQGDSLVEKARSFLLKLKNKIELVNTFNRKLLVVASGREIIVDKCLSELKDGGNVYIIRLLPYYISDDLSRHESLLEAVNSELILADQRKEWWPKFSALVGREVPYYIYEYKLEDLTSLPLLNCLLAIAMQNGFDYKTGTNLNEVYRYLIFSVYAKEYPGDKRNRRDSRISFEDFLHIMSEIAYCAWLNNGRTIDVSSVEEHLKETDTLPVFKRFYSDLRNDLNSLFVLFYFRSSEKYNLGSQVFEFTHKSFTEYLMSLNISKTFINLCKLYISDRTAKQEVIEKMKKLTYRNNAIYDIKKLIYNELIKNDNITTIKSFTIMFIMDTFHNDSIKGYGTMNTFDPKYQELEGFIFSLYNEEIGKIVSQKVEICDEHSLRNFLFRNNHETSLNFIKISHLYYACTSISFFSFQSVDLALILFKMIQMMKVSFNNSTFREVTFFRSELKSLSIQDCTLSNGGFNDVVFEELMITNTELNHVNFEDIKFRRSTVTDSILDSCVFKNILYSGLKFSNCTFKNIDFTDISFFSSYLISKELSGNKFIDCKISAKRNWLVSKLPSDLVKRKILGIEVV